ncbi:MAG: helix-turn-helix domain-containing protein [Rhodoferax sp.]|nr:helix-turn-helix domain-containing protein [Rhodoferax sp.]
MTDKTFSLDELCALTDLSKRTVRYYMQLGLVDRPIGETRAAHYVSRHLDQLLRVKHLTDAGVSLERIGEVMAGGDTPVPIRLRRPGSIEVRSHLYVAPGLEIQISPDEAGMTPEQVRAFVREVMQAAERVMRKDKVGD